MTRDTHTDEPPCFRALWWLRNRHAQTVWAAVCRRPPSVALSPERLELDDGDFLDLFWGPHRDSDTVVLLLHGLGGCARSPYILGLIARLSARGVQCVVMQYRGAGPPNRLDRFYHAGDHADAARAATHVGRARPGATLHAVGVSLGGSILLNWLADTGKACPVQRAVAVSPPFDLGACADAVNHGFARVYQHNLLRGLKRMYTAKYRDRPAPVAVSTVAAMPTLRAFDDRITAPFHGFRDADDYYRRCSCGPRLAAIARPALVLHALDDPFIPAAGVPRPDAIAAGVRLTLTARGGHVGFVSAGASGLWPRYWAEAAAEAYLLDGLPEAGPVGGDAEAAYPRGAAEVRQRETGGKAHGRP